MGKFFFQVTFLAMAVLVASAISMTSPSITSSWAASTIKVGVMGPTTGSWASEGQDMVKVIEILADQINAKGGLRGDKVEVVVGDDGGTPKSATLAAQRLLTLGVVAVVGTYGSSVTEATQDIYDEAGVPQIATGSTSIRLSEKGLKKFFRTCPRDDEQGRVLAGKVKELGFSRPAIVHDNTSYAKGLADEARAIFKSQGISEVYYDAINPGDRDFAVALSKIQAQNPDIIVFTGYYPEAAMILRQKREKGWNVPVIGGDATNNRTLVEIAGRAAAAGYYFVSPPSLGDMKTPEAVEFLKVYQAKHNSLPSSVWAVLAGDAFQVIAEAIGNVGADSTKIATYLHNDLKDFKGLSGSISFDEKGDRIGEVYRLYQVDEQGDFSLRE
ncbi:MAG: branched-chain amino acid ABC transporter substrate-binding protein [Deltaproteobacteria bacterium]|jgi:branched-chain amino acid transport system substrate-binding protein|nr:branched-chain amino acid ABC transporter substrate-binding protein [Deltaproteobacteria bacterium]